MKEDIYIWYLTHFLVLCDVDSIGKLIACDEVEENIFDTMFLTDKMSIDDLKKIQVNMNVKSLMSDYVRDSSEKERKKMKEISEDFTKLQKKLQEEMQNILKKKYVLELENERYLQMQNSVDCVEYAKIERKFNENLMELDRLLKDFRGRSGAFEGNKKKFFAKKKEFERSQKAWQKVYSARFDLISAEKRETEDGEYLFVRAKFVA